MCAVAAAQSPVAPPTPPTPPAPVAPPAPPAPPVQPDQPAPSAPIDPVLTLPSVDKVGASDVEPPAAASLGPVITPAQEAAEIRASGAFLAPLIPEGGFLTRATGSLGRDEFFGVWMFELLDRVDGASNRKLILLPAEPLADMIVRHLASVKDGSSAPMFELSGQVLVFRGRNFLLPTFVAPVNRIITPSVRSFLVAPGSKTAIEMGAQVSAQAQAQAAGLASAPSVAISTAPSEAAATPVVPASAENAVNPETFAQDLERRLNARVAVVPSSADASPVAAAAPAGIEQPSLAVAAAGDTNAETMPPIEARTQPAAMNSASVAAPHGLVMPVMPPMRIQSRRGTMTRDPVTGGWRFIFASGHRDDGDVALDLLPCAKLTELIASARSSSAPLGVMLTGDITVFEGRNYLRPVRSQVLGAGKWIGP